MLPHSETTIVPVIQTTRNRELEKGYLHANPRGLKYTVFRHASSACVKQKQAAIGPKTQP